MRSYNPRTTHEIVWLDAEATIAKIQPLILPNAYRQPMKYIENAWGDLINTGDFEKLTQLEKKNGLLQISLLHLAKLKTM